LKWTFSELQLLQAAQKIQYWQGQEARRDGPHMDRKVAQQQLLQAVSGRECRHGTGSETCWVTFQLEDDASSNFPGDEREPVLATGRGETCASEQKSDDA
jgi:hypothetical protein